MYWLDPEGVLVHLYTPGLPCRPCGDGHVLYSNHLVSQILLAIVVQAWSVCLPTRNYDSFFFLKKNKGKKERFVVLLKRANFPMLILTIYTVYTISLLLSPPCANCVRKLSWKISKLGNDGGTKNYGTTVSTMFADLSKQIADEFLSWKRWEDLRHVRR